MTRLPGDKPERTRNFHGTKGEHLFPHPGTYARKSDWTAWDRRYAAHLDRHRELIDNPEPQDDDPQIILDLFAHIEHLEKIVAKEKLLITALRQRAAQHPEADELEMPELRARLKDGGNRS